jgi:uncharacterized protein YcbK (DUF882 family)
MWNAALLAVARPRTGAGTRNYLSFIAIVLAVICLGATPQAHADDSIERNSDGLLGRAGFVNHVDSADRPARQARRESSSPAVSAKPRAERKEAVASSSSSEAASSARRNKGTRVASIDRSESYTPPKRSITGGGNVNWVASASCLASNLRSAINYVAQNYGSVTVNSTCRSASHNRRVGGAPKSYHLTGDAADIRIHGNVSGATAYLRSAVGGFKHYGGGLYHIDNGPSRSF